MMLLLGMVGSATVFGLLLDDFSQLRLIQIIQGAAALTMVLNLVALWKQEAREPGRTRGLARGQDFGLIWRDYVHGGRTGRMLVALGLGTAGFSMQDILLEPYGGQILGLTRHAARWPTLAASAAATSKSSLPRHALIK